MDLEGRSNDLFYGTNWAFAWREQQ